MTTKSGQKFFSNASHLSNNFHPVHLNAGSERSSLFFLLCKLKNSSKRLKCVFSPFPMTFLELHHWVGLLQNHPGIRNWKPSTNKFGSLYDVTSYQAAWSHVPFRGISVPGPMFLGVGVGGWGRVFVWGTPSGALSPGDLWGCLSGGSLSQGDSCWERGVWSLSSPPTSDGSHCSGQYVCWLKLMGARIPVSWIMGEHHTARPPTLM